MLKSLSIENIAVIEKATIDFEGGFNVLTGETGAGKSIIIDSINMILGERSSRDLIRRGANKAKVVALFDQIGQGALDAISQAGFDPSGFADECLIQRTISIDGKSVCKINGMPITAAMLRKIAVNLINIHGQHDNQVLFDSSTHCGFIDAIAGISDELNTYKDEFTKLKKIRRELIALKEEAEAKEESEELWRFQIDELTQADLKIGEREQLTKRKNAILNSEKIASALDNAYNCINGNEAAGVQGTFSLMADALNRLEGIQPYFGEIQDFLIQFRENLYSLGELKNDLSDFLSQIDYNPEELEEIEERLDFIYRLSLKYGDTEEEMLEYLSKIETELQKLESSDELINQVTDQYNALLEKCVSMAEDISAKRKKSADDFSKNIENELSFLNMPSVHFSVSFEKGNLSSNGFDIVEFLISTNVGDKLKPISKIASGGELSRIMLAVKNVLSKNDSIDTLIFDEIDTGVSGNAAIKIAMKLKEVSAFRQVICVTHLPQIASFASSHFLIEKTSDSEGTYTTVKQLNTEAREKELARMVYGGEITSAQLKTAKEMLEFAKTH